MIRKLLAALCALLAILSLAGWYEFHFRWRDCFNEEGRCFDPENAVVYHAQSGAGWMMMAVFFAAFAALLFWHQMRGLGSSGKK